MFIIIGVIIFAFFGLILSWRINIKYGEHLYMIPDIILGTLLSILAGIVITMIISVVALNISGEKEIITTKTIPIYAFQDNQNMSYPVYLKFRYTKESFCYYIYQTTDGGYKIDYVDQDNITIHYVINKEDCRVEIRETHFKNPIHNWIAESLDEDNVSYVFYIPKESIIDEYNIDL